MYKNFNNLLNFLYWCIFNQVQNDLFIYLFIYLFIVALG